MNFKNYNIIQNLENLISEMLPFNNFTKPLLNIEYEGQEYQIQIKITANKDEFIDESKTINRNKNTEKVCKVCQKKLITEITKADEEDGLYET